MRNYIKRELTGLELTVGFREDFEFWKVKSFNLISDEVRRVFREFLITRGVNIAVRRGLKIPVAFARAVEEDNGAEDRLAQRRSAEVEAVELMKMERATRATRATLRGSTAGSPRQTQQLSPMVALRPPSFPTFPMNTQQARPAPGTDFQPPLAHRQPQQLQPKVMESHRPSKHEKKTLPDCPIPMPPQHVPQEKLLPPQLLHETPRPTLLQKDLADISDVKITASSHRKPESAPVDKAVTDSVNNTLAEPRHALLPAPSDDSTPTIAAEQRPDEPLDKGAPADEQESAAAHYEDSADVEESDGPIDDRKRKEKETLRGEFAPATYMLSPV
ncbi:hypothetical protein E4U19_007431 [Claviceps sp. Clav32 group G5]|nr:hypothetical protein E4U19_007431 [Claviceps sp. Clav32 group G5]